MAASFSTYGLQKSPHKQKLKLADCTCPICLYISIEPITMPCGHELCRPCFHQNVQQANLSCPMCRTRISTWTRKATRDNKLVNEKRWEQIKAAFPDKVQRRLDGQEELYSSDEEEEPLPAQYLQIAEHGAIRREYEEQLKQLEEERLRALAEEEDKSRQLIAQLEEEEQRTLLEKQKRAEEDEQLAKELNERLKQADIDLQSPEVRSFLEKKGQSLRAGSALDKFIKKTPRRADGTLPDDVIFPSFSSHSPTPTAATAIEDFRVASSNRIFFGDADSLGGVAGGAASGDYLYISSRNSSILGAGGKDAAAALGLGTDITSPAGLSDLSSVIVLGSSNYSNSASSTPVTSRSASHNKATRLDQWLSSSQQKPTMTSSFKSCHNIPKALQEEEKAIPVSPKTFFSRISTKSSLSACKTTSPAVHSVSSSPVCSTPPPAAMTRTESGDSLGQEMVHFRPIVVSPRTPPRRLPGGKVHDPPVVRSTPVNLQLSPKKDRSGNDVSAIPMTSPVMQRSLRVLAAQRQAHVSAFSKATLTEAGSTVKDNPMKDSSTLPCLTEQSYWSPKKRRLVKVQPPPLPAIPPPSPPAPPHSPPPPSPHSSSSGHSPQLCSGETNDGIITHVTDTEDRRHKSPVTKPKTLAVQSDEEDEVTFKETNNEVTSKQTEEEEVTLKQTEATNAADTQGEVRCIPESLTAGSDGCPSEHGDIVTEASTPAETPKKGQEKATVRQLFGGPEQCEEDRAVSGADEKDDACKKQEKQGKSVLAIVDEEEHLRDVEEEEHEEASQSMLCPLSGSAGKTHAQPVAKHDSSENSKPKEAVAEENVVVDETVVEAMSQAVKDVSKAFDSTISSTTTSLQGSEALSNSQGKVYKMKTKHRSGTYRDASASKKRKGSQDGNLPGSKYDHVQYWLHHCTESESDELVDEVLYNGDALMTENTGKDNEAAGEKGETMDGMQEYYEQAEQKEEILQGKPKEGVGGSGLGTGKSKDVKPKVVAKAKPRRKGKLVADNDSVVSSHSSRSKLSLSRWLNKDKKDTDHNDNAISGTKCLLSRSAVLSEDAEKENSLDSFDSANLNVGPQRSSQVPEKGKVSTRGKRASANLDFSSGSPRKRMKQVSEDYEFDVEYSPTHDGKKKLIQKSLRKEVVQKKRGRPRKIIDNDTSSVADNDGDANELSQEMKEQLKGLHENRKERSEFNSEKDYHLYIEEQDRLLALKLQADFDFEARFHLNSVRRKGSEEEYQLRRGRQKTDYAKFFSDAGCSKPVTRRSRRK